MRRNIVLSIPIFLFLALVAINRKVTDTYLFTINREGNVTYFPVTDSLRLMVGLGWFRLMGDREAIGAEG